MTHNITIKKQNKKSILKTITRSKIYNPTEYGISNRYTGKGVKITIIDSGCPKHKDIKTNGDKISFCENNQNEYDKNGHATMISGVINANNRKAVKGLAPHSQVNYAKVINDQGYCDFNSIVAAVLWAVVKKTDIIVMALGSQYDYPILHDAIKKAYNNNITIFAAGKLTKNKEEIDYPARYEEVFSVCSLTRSKKSNKIIQQKNDFCLPNKKMYTTYLDNLYIGSTGSSMSTSTVAAISSLLIEKKRASIKPLYTPESLYIEIDKILNS
jgi:major intracellular serine protease